MQQTDPDAFCPASRQEWRQWLKKNHRTRTSVWLIYYKKDAGVSTITYSEAVDEALCFGWIDSTRRSLSDDRFTQYFCRRKPGSSWSKVNKAKVEQLTAGGLMTKAGTACIEQAQQDGSWTKMDAVEELTVPPDLAKAFKSYPGSKTHFLSWSRSVRKAVLHWVETAKRPETRHKRITETAALAAQGLKPKQFR